MKILVTGASGFVGKDLVKKLKKQKHKIIEFNSSDGNNIFDKKKLDEKMKNIDIVIHLAAKLDGDEKEILKTNVDGTKNVIDIAIKNNVKKFILISSTGVYGNTKSLVNEDSEKNPENTYEKSKLSAENIVLSYREKINVNILRSAMIFGPNKYWNNLFKILKKGFPLPCSGNNTFQIIYVKDLVNAIILLTKKGSNGEIYLVSGNEKWTLKEFCRYSNKILKNNKKLFTIPSSLAIIIGKILNIRILNKENIRHLSKDRNYSIEKIKKLGFKQKYPLKIAIKKTIKDLE